MMQHPVLTLGDTDSDVASGLTALERDLAGDRPRAVVAFADLRDLSRQSGKERLRALGTLAVLESKRNPAIRHLVFAVKLAPRHAGAFDRIASALGARLHADLERDNGRDVEVTFLDVSGCGDVPTLTSRLLARCEDPIGQHGVVVLDWDDIRHDSIRNAARNEYL